MTARKIDQVLPRSAEAHRDGGRVHRESTAVLDGLRQRGKIPALALEGALESCLQELAVHNVVMDVEGSVRSHGRRASMR